MLKRLVILTCLSFLIFISCEKEEDDDKPNFIGSWQCDESSQVFGRSIYNVNILQDPNNSSRVKIANFYQFGFSDLCYADINGNYIIIPTQYFCDHTISGKGEIDNKGTTIIWRYTVVGAGRTDSCSAIYTKK